MVLEIFDLQLRHAGSFSCGMQNLSCCMRTLSHGMWDLVPEPGLHPGPPALGVWSVELATGPPGKFLYIDFLSYDFVLHSLILSFWVESLEFSVYNILLSVNSEQFYFFLPDLDVLLSSNCCG